MIIWITLFVVSTASINFLPQRVIIVDNHNQNYLVRGNMPMKNDVFVMQELQNTLSKVTGINKSKQQIIIYSLINHYTDFEAKNALIQQTYFNIHPNHGKLFFYPILGCFISPSWIPRFMFKYAVSKYQNISFDKLDFFLQLLHKELLVGKNKIIYFHCTHGLDRTGLVYGAYQMKFKGTSLNRVIQYNTNIAKRKLKYTALNGMEWFCYQLKLTKFTLNCNRSKNNIQ